MEIIISNTSKSAIYEQIYTQIKNQIISGTLAENEPLPSIRALAKSLRVSVITTKRAYDELERDGFIYTVSGKGSYVAPRNTDLIREEYLMQIEEHLESALGLAAAAGITTDEVIEILKTIKEDINERS